MIDLQQGNGDQGWEKPFQGFPQRLNKPPKQIGAKSRQMINSQQGQRTHDIKRQSPEKQMAKIFGRKLAVQASTFKPLGQSDISFKFWDLGKFRYLGSDLK
ncbi:MAG: hypothetical protein EZS28_019189, partial [Streblomastix strix]